MKMNGVIFDFDGTLIDSYTNRIIAQKKVCKNLSKYLGDQDFSFEHETLLNLIINIEIEMSEVSEWDRNIWWKKVINKVIKKDISVPLSILEDTTLIYWNTIMERSFLYPEIHNLLQKLKSKEYLLGLISDTDGLTGMKTKRIAYSGLKKYFNAILIAGEDTKEVKPSEIPFFNILKNLKIPANKCIYIGDFPKVDIPGAKLLGMKTIIIENSVDYSIDKGLYPDLRIKRENIIDLYPAIVNLLN